MAQKDWRQYYVVNFHRWNLPLVFKDIEDARAHVRICPKGTVNGILHVRGKTLEAQFFLRTGALGKYYPKLGKRL